MSQTCFMNDQPSSLNVNNVSSSEHGTEEEISNELYPELKLSSSSSKNVSKTSLEKRYQSSKISLNRKKSYTVSSCRICLSHLVNPGVLTCGHRFCEECLYNYWKNGEKAECIVCPLCRKCTENFEFVEIVDRTQPSFRNSLGALERARKSNFTSICLKTSLFLPALYCIAKGLKWFFIDFIFKS